MKKNLFKPIKAGAATAIIAIASLFSYGVGLFRDRILAVNFGTSSATDTYNAAFLIPDMLFNLFIAGALTAAFLPIFTQTLEKDKEKAYNLANTTITAGSILISTLAIIAFIFMPKIIPFLFNDANIKMQTDIINMTRLMLPSAILFAISNTVGNILMSHKHFFSYAISPIFYNLGIIIGISLLHERFGIYSAAIGVLTGATLHCIIRIIDLTTTKYRYKPQLLLSDPKFKKILKLMIPKSISLIGWQINLLIFAKVGMQITEGGLSAFHFARNIQSFAVSIFGISFATAIFPFLSTAATEKDKTKYTKHIQQTTQRILFFTIPAAVGISLLAKDIIELVLGGGVFDKNSITLTSSLLIAFAISIPFESLTHILARAFYSLKNTITPMIINIITMLIIAYSSIFIAPIFGIQWFSIGFSIGFIFYIFTATLLLKKYMKNFKTKAFVLSLSKTLISSGIMALCIFSISHINTNIPSYLMTLIKISIGGVTFLITAFILKSPELSSVNYILGRILKK